MTGDAPLPTIAASVDARSGQAYVPPRVFSVAGDLVELESTELEPAGVLATVIDMGGRSYGYVDLPGQVRLLARIDDTEPRVGDLYRAWLTADGEKVFRHDG